MVHTIVVILVMKTIGITVMMIRTMVTVMMTCMVTTTTTIRDDSQIAADNSTGKNILSKTQKLNEKEKSLSR